MEKEKESIILAATKDADIIVERSKQRGVEKESEILKEAQLKSDRILEEASMKAREEKQKALTESKEEIARMTIMGMEKILKK